MRFRCLLPIAALLALSPRGAAAQPTDDAFKQGREAMNKGDFKRALTLLRASHAREPGKGKLLNIALCEEQLGLSASALAHFEELAPQFPASDERAGIVAKHRAAVDKIAPRLQLTLAPGAPAATSATLDGAAVKIGKELRVDPGPHTVIASAPGALDQRESLNLSSGDRKTLSLAPAPPTPVSPPPEPATPARPWGWSVGIAATSLGGAALLAGLGVGGAALSKRSTLAKQCDANRVCDPSQQATIDGYHELGAASTGLIIAGGLVAAGGVVLLVISPGGPKDQKSGFVAPTIGLGTMGVRGAFQ